MMTPIPDPRSIHKALSHDLSKNDLLFYVQRWQEAHPTWTWRFERDALQPGDWVLELVAPTGQTQRFFLRPVEDLLHLIDPAPLLDLVP
jgi:hypothetical protein